MLLYRPEHRQSLVLQALEANVGGTLASSYRVWVLLAMNSVMRTWAEAARAVQTNGNAPR